MDWLKLLLRWDDCRDWSFHAELFQLWVNFCEHEVSQIRIAPVSGVRGDSSNVSVSRLFEDIVHSISKPLAIRRLDLGLGLVLNLTHVLVLREHRVLTEGCHRCG